MNDAGRDVSDDDFSFRLGLPLGSLDPQIIYDHVQQAADLGIDELILAPPIPVRDLIATYQALPELLVSSRRVSK